jgi:hypothetical protein
MGVGLGAWGGPLTAGAIVTKLQLDYILNKIAGFEKGWTNATLGQAFSNLKKTADPVIKEARDLAVAIAFRDSPKPEEAEQKSIHRKYRSVAKKYARDTKTAVGKLLDVATHKTQMGSYWETWQQPGYYKEIRNTYTPFIQKYNNASTPEQVFTLAYDILGATIQLMANYNAHACKFLKEAHGDSIIFGGIHEDICGP